MRLSSTFAAVLVLSLVAVPAAQAGWSRPIPLGPAGQQSAVVGLAANGQDRPAVLLTGGRSGHAILSLRRTDARGRLGKPLTVATSKNFIEGVGLFAGRGTDLVAGWLQLINGSRRPVVATGPGLADRQVLAPGPRSTQIMDLAANRRGDAVVAFWRYSGEQYSIYAAYRPAGGRFGAAQLLVTGYVGDPAVAIGDDGEAVVSWTERTGVFVASRAAGAPAFGAAVDVAPTTRPNGDTGVAIDGGRTLVSWVTAPRLGPNSVLVARRATPAAPFTSPVAVSVPGITAPRQAPEVVIGGGRAIVAWTQRVDHVDSAAVAIDPSSGDDWQAPVVRGLGASVRRIGLLAAVGDRPPLLTMATDSRGVQTATIRDDGHLAASRRPDSGTRGTNTYVAHGAARTWLATSRIAGTDRRPVVEGLLFGSTRS
jgi:hypothetical protein